MSRTLYIRARRLLCNSDTIQPSWHHTKWILVEIVLAHSSTVDYLSPDYHGTPSVGRCHLSDSNQDKDTRIVCKPQRAWEGDSFFVARSASQPPFLKENISHLYGICYTLQVYLFCSMSFAFYRRNNILVGSPMVSSLEESTTDEKNRPIRTVVSRGGTFPWFAPFAFSIRLGRWQSFNILGALVYTWILSNDADIALGGKL